MSDLDPLFNEMTQTLRHARQAVGDSFEVHKRTRDPDALTHLAAADHSFAEQAGGLLNVMVNRDPRNPRINEVEDLLDFFRQFERLIGAAIRVSRAQAQVGSEAMNRSARGRG